MKLKKIMAGLLVAAMTITVVPAHNNEQNVVLAAQSIGSVDTYTYEQFVDYTTLMNEAETNSWQKDSGYGDAMYAFDAEENGDQTYWHQNYGNTGVGPTATPSEGNPIYIQTSFGREVKVGKLSYTARSDGNGNNAIGNYTISVIVSKDADGNIVDPAEDADWKVAKRGAFLATASEQVVTFTPQNATHIRLTAYSKVGGGSHHVVARSIKLYTATDNLTALIEKAEAEVAAIKTAGQQSLYDLTRAEAIIAQAKEAKTDEEKAAVIQLFEETGMNKAIPFEDENGRGLYLSDVEWTSFATGYGSAGVVRDGAHKDSAEAATTALMLRNEDDGSTFTTFAKGVGAHATGYVQVDVSDYKKFTSYYGTSGNKTQYGDINYKIFLDGTEATQYRGSSSYNTGMDYWDVDLANASVLKIAFEEGDNKHNDHAGFGDAKLYTHLVCVPEAELEVVLGDNVTEIEDTDKYTVKTQWSVGEGEETPTQFVKDGVYTLTATFTANDKYYFTESSLENWALNLTQNGVVVGEAQPTSKNVSEDRSELQATWTIEVGETKTCSVQTQVANGSEGMGTVNASDLGVAIGQSTTITATPNDTSRFVRWETVDGVLVSRDATATVAPTVDTTYYAVFQPKDTYLDLVNIALNSTVTLSEGTVLEQGGFSQELSVLVDGVKGDNNFGKHVAYVNNSGNNAAYVQIDLGKVYGNLDSVKLYRLVHNNREYGSTRVELSVDAEFTNPVVVFDSYKDGGTEVTYQETSEGKAFTVPAGTKARYLRVYTEGGAATEPNMKTQHVGEIEVWASNPAFVSNNNFEVSAGTEQSGNPVSYLVDGNKNNNWHSQWSDPSDANEMHKFWIDVKFDEPTVVNGVNTLPLQPADNVNGIITGYEIWVKTTDDNEDPVNVPSNELEASIYKATWQANYKKVCEGTWNHQSDGNTWKGARFEPTEVTHLRLVITDSHGAEVVKNKRHASMRELQVTTPSATEKVAFEGGSLRMDYVDNYDIAMLRLMYEFPKTLSNGMSVDTDNNKWGWKYSIVSAEDTLTQAETPVSPGKYKLEDGVYYSNLVFKNIARKDFERSIYTQFVVNYKNESGETLKIYSDVSNRSVQGVAEAITKAYNGTQNEDEKVQFVYAAGILGYNAQLAKSEGNFTDELINLEECLYTFVAVDGGYTIKGILADGTTEMYLKPSDKGNVPANTTVTVEEYPGEEPLKFKFKNVDGDGQTYHLHFYDDDTSKLHYDRCTNDGCTGHKFEIYKLGESDDSNIKGYTRVVNLNDLNEAINNGSRFLIAIQANDGSYYVLHPTNTTNRYDHVAKVLK